MTTKTELTVLADRLLVEREDEDAADVAHAKLVQHIQNIHGPLDTPLSATCTPVPPNNVVVPTPELFPENENVRTRSFEKGVDKVLDSIRSMLLMKNASYGDSALNPIRVFSKADASAGIRVRIDDKISRLQRGHEIGEDTVRDLVGYLVMLLISEDRS